MSFGPNSNDSVKTENSPSSENSTQDTGYTAESSTNEDLQDTASQPIQEPSSEEPECYELDGTPKPCEGAADSGAAPNQPAQDCYDEQGLLIPCLGQEDDVSEIVFDGTLMLTELMLNPTGNNSLGQWIEIFINLPIDSDGVEIPTNIQSLTISNGSNSFVFSEIFIEQSGFYVFGRNADYASNGGVNIDYEYHGVLLSTLSEQAFVQFSLPGQVLDDLHYSQFTSFQELNEGASLQLFPGVDHPELNNNEDMWCSGTAPIVQGNYGTPGSPNSLCPINQ